MATVNYKYPKDKLSVEQQRCIEDNVDEFSRIIRKIVNQRDYCHLSLSVGYVLEEHWGRDVQDISVSSNADFSIPKTLSFVDVLNTELHDRHLATPIKNGRLLITIKFSVKEKDAEKKDSDSIGNLREKGDEETNSPIFLPIQPKYTFEQLIIPESVRNEISSALSVIKNKKLIYEDWGFGKIEPNPRSILNFYGEPGTGKSMCAHAIASELGRPLLALNYADIESKYVGEAAKNLKRAFETAKETDAVMFFDEADSFLGKRIENVNSGSDQALNSLRSQMLIYLEEFTGVVLFATNLVTNFDRAFESRILNHIKFELPNREARAAILEKMIPVALPKEREFSKDDYLEVSDLIDGLSGREIKTAIQSMLLDEAQKKGSKAIFTVDLLKKSLAQKKESKERLKNEENERLKKKIEKKLQEKSMETEAETNHNSIYTSRSIMENERQYIEAYREASKSGTVSDVERKLLNHLRDALGIDEKRANDMECNMLP